MSSTRIYKYVNIDFDNIDYEELRQYAVSFSEEFPNSYFNYLNRNKLFDNFKTTIEKYTYFLPENSKITTRIFYLRNRFTQVLKCYSCGKHIIRDFNGLQNKYQSDIFCNNPNCVCKIGTNVKHDGSTFSTRNDLPLECSIEYNGNDIIYDDNMNSKLLDFYIQHPKTFKYHIKNNIELYNYLMEKSYPLNYTNLNMMTRLKWVLEKMQRFPKCCACGRNIDFKNIKFSHSWPKYCCNECKEHNLEKSTNIHIRNSKNMYYKMKNMDMTSLLFSLDDFINRKKDTRFKCCCNICGHHFESIWDENFYRRNGNHKSYFRCPNCFPYVNSGKSKVENEVLEFLTGKYSGMDIISHTKGIISPYELDIYIKDMKIGLEFNGVYWHSLEYDKKNYNKHLNKTIKCEENGIVLIHIWEDEWFSNKEQIKNLVSDIIEDKVNFEQYLSNNNLILPRDIFNMEFIKRHGLCVSYVSDINIVKRKHINSNVYYNLTDCGNIICKL